MTKGRRLHVYDYVNHPYEQVRDALKGDASRVFQSATKAATSRAHSVAAELHVNIGGIELGTDVTISVGKVEEQAGKLRSPPSTRLDLEWQATKSPHLFPLMKAELAVYPLTATETQLDLSGLYEPPMGVLGSAIDAIVGHRIAEASVHHFVSDLANYLKETLTDSGD